MFPISFCGGFRGNAPKKSLAEHHEGGDAQEDETPEVIRQNPSIEHFIVNMIDTNHGIQVPALIHSLVETFNRDGITQDIFSDKKLLSWINKQLMAKQHKRDETPAHIGRGVGIRVDYRGGRDPNRDPFTLLVPDRGVF